MTGAGNWCGGCGGENVSVGHGDAACATTQDDASVAGGFLAVTVRPWQVMMRRDAPGGAGA